MTNKWILVFGLSVFTLQAQAIEISKCPQTIQFHAKVERVFKTSTYSGTPGWKDAQKTLMALQEFQSEFFLVTKEKKICRYQDEFKNSADLRTANFFDPEDGENYQEDQFVPTLHIDGSTYTSFIPVKAYSVGGVELHSLPYSLKIKTRLFAEGRIRPSLYDLGMISVEVK